MEYRDCFLRPPENSSAIAKELHLAAKYHAEGDFEKAKIHLLEADDSKIRDWTLSILGTGNRDLYGPGPEGSISKLPKDSLDKIRMPNTALKNTIIQRDGWNCRHCGLELIDRNTAKRIVALYPNEAKWSGRQNEKHAMLRAMEIQFDHVVPHSRGGRTTEDNLILTCVPCNYGRGNWTLEECRLKDPRNSKLIKSNWNGLVGEFSS